MNLEHHSCQAGALPVASHPAPALSVLMSSDLPKQSKVLLQVSLLFQMFQKGTAMWCSVGKGFINFPI